MFALPAEDVRCIYIEGSGCYGRNGHEDAAADAALLAKAVGKPVRVQWMRADEHGWDPKGPPTLIDLRGGARCVRQRRRRGSRSSSFRSRRRAASWCRWSRRRSPACRQKPDIAPGNIFQNSDDSLRVRQHQSGVPPARDDAVPSVVDPHAGADAEHLCQRMLHRRTRGGRRCRSRSSSG